MSLCTDASTVSPPDSGYLAIMGRESAGYHLQLPAELEDTVVLVLREGGAEPGDSATRGSSCASATRTAAR
jgi:hypothetical protein